MTPTPTPLTTLIKEMRETAEKATPGPWTRSLVYHYDQTLTYIEQEQTEKIVIETASGISKENTKHICLTNPENIRRVLDALQECREALDFYSKGGNFSLDLWESPGLGHFTGKRARAVLAKHFPEVRNRDE